MVVTPELLFPNDEVKVRKLPGVVLIVGEFAVIPVPDSWKVMCSVDPRDPRIRSRERLDVLDTSCPATPRLYYVVQSLGPVLVPDEQTTERALIEPLMRRGTQ